MSTDSGFALDCAMRLNQKANGKGYARQDGTAQVKEIYGHGGASEMRLGG